MEILDFVYDNILEEEDFLTEADFKAYAKKVKEGLQKAAAQAKANGAIRAGRRTLDRINAEAEREAKREAKEKIKKLTAEQKAAEREAKRPEREAKAAKVKKNLKRTALGVAAAGALAAAPGVVGGVKNVKREAAQSEMDKAGKEYNYSRAEDRTNEFAQELRKKGIEFKDTATKYGKEYGSKAKAYGAEKAAEGKAFAGAYKELKFAAKSLDAAINADVKSGPDIVANFNAECNQIKEKYGEEA